MVSHVEPGERATTRIRFPLATPVTAASAAVQPWGMDSCLRRSGYLWSTPDRYGEHTQAVIARGW